MKLPFYSNERIVLIASSALVLSGLMQLGTAWLQYAARANTDCAVLQVRAEGKQEHEYSESKQIAQLRHI